MGNDKRRAPESCRFAGERRADSVSSNQGRLGRLIELRSRADCIGIKNEALPNSFRSDYRDENQPQSRGCLLLPFGPRFFIASRIFLRAAVDKCRFRPSVRLLDDGLPRLLWLPNQESRDTIPPSSRTGTRNLQRMRTEALIRLSSSLRAPSLHLLCSEPR